MDVLHTPGLNPEPAGNLGEATEVDPEFAGELATNILFPGIFRVNLLMRSEKMVASF